MAGIVWPRDDVLDVRTSTALRELQERTTQAERDAREREGMLSQPSQAAQPQQSSDNGWNFSSLRSTLMPWDTSQSATAAAAPSAAPQSMTATADPWDFKSLLPSLTPWAPQQQPPPTPSGTPAAMPTAPGLTPATITSGPKPGQTLQPGESVGSVTIQQGPPPAPGTRQAHARAMAEKYGLDWGIFDRQLTQESGYQDNAVSSAGARGPGQFMPETGNAVARQMGVTPEQFWASPELQIEGAALHMSDLLKANGGNYRMALAAYNAGQGNVDKYGEGVFDDDFANGQTRDYVNIILGPGAARAGRQSSMNVGAGAPTVAASAAAGPGGASSSTGAGSLPPSVAAKWRNMYGRDPSPEETQELMGMLGVMA